MRTTVTLEDDVAARLERLRKGRNFKQLVNSLLRTGLDQLERQPKTEKPYSIRPVKGKPKRTDLDNVAELIAESEGDAYN